MALHIVRATRESLAQLVPLFDAYRQFYRQQSDVDAARRFLSARIEQSQSVIFLALQEAQAVGFAQLYPAFSSVAMRPIWILNDLFVAPEARRVGLGRRLLQTAKDFAVAGGAKRLVLSTAIDNLAAQSLYEQMGWQKDEAFIQYRYEL